MTDSQEQSLNEDTVFLPVSETSPGFLYSESERLALERLLNAGPEVFYSTIGTGQTNCFLSPEEVTDITKWAQDYQLSPLPKEKNGEISQGLDFGHYSSTYYPAHSDTLAPCLALGWPQDSPRGQEDSAKVYTSPPNEGEPSVRELIRRKLQTATQVIAVVTDKLTDCAVIGDLHTAASRGVPVYIILNKRSAQENTLIHLRHPNIQVRVLEGKSFCSRTGRMVVGEMKDKFVLVDLQTVIHGSYSLTWSDAHLHRQLVTALTGTVVDSFDREFRILFAASSPVPEPRRSSCGQITNPLYNYPDTWFPKQLPFSDTEVINPPSPPGDTLLDWEAMGVLSGGCNVPHIPFDLHEDVFLKDQPVLNNVMDEHPKFVDNFFSNKHLVLDKKRLSEPPPPTSLTGNYVPHLFTSHSKTLAKQKEPPSPELRGETRLESFAEKTVARQISYERPKYMDDKFNKRSQKEQESFNYVNAFSHVKRTPDVNVDSTAEEETSCTKESAVFKMENTPSSRKPVILRVPHAEDTGPLNDIMKRVKKKQSTKEPQRHHSKTAISELSHSMVDLAIHSTEKEDKVNPVPRFRAGMLDVELVAPALALMQKRNDYVRSALYRSPLSSQPRQRPRSFAFRPDWRKALSELDVQDEEL